MRPRAGHYALAGRDVGSDRSRARRIHPGRASIRIIGAEAIGEAMMAWPVSSSDQWTVAVTTLELAETRPVVAL